MAEMNILYAAVLPTGEIVQTGQAPTFADLLDMEIQGATIVPSADWVDDARHYWNGDAFVEFPPRPGPWAVWDGSEWFDPRTPEDHEAELRAWREAATLTKSEFLQACIAHRILTPKEASIASRGDIPEPFQRAVLSLSPEQQDMLPVIWPAVTRVTRMDPLLVALAESASLSNETLDALFGLAP